MRKRALVSGAVIVALYVVVTAISFDHGLQPVRPLFEGISPPPPYQWVNPPPDLAAGNVPATSGSDTIHLTSTGSEPATPQTTEGQAYLTFPPDALEPSPPEKTVTVTLVPLDPATLGPPPAGQHYDGNAYKIDAIYTLSGKPARFIAPVCPAPNKVTSCATLFLQYPFNADAIYRSEGTGWSKLDSLVVASARQIYANVNRLGTFVATNSGSTTPGPAPGKGGGKVLPFVLGLVAFLLIAVLGRVQAKRSRKKKRGGKPKKKVTAKKKIRSVKRYLKE